MTALPAAMAMAQPAMTPYPPRPTPSKNPPPAFRTAMTTCPARLGATPGAEVREIGGQRGR
jgi:hypothetical protein